MDDSPVEEYRDKMTDWGLPLSQYSQQCQACFAPQSGSGLDIVENTEQGRQANQYRYPRPERRYSVFRNQGTVAPEYSFSNAPTLRSILAILKNGQDKIPLHKTADQQHPEPVKATSPAKSSHRGITRGADAFRKGGANA